MAKDTAATPAQPAPLPSIDSLSFVTPDELPEPVGGPALTADEIALAKAIVDGAQGGKVAVGPKVGDRAAAQATAARMRRLVTRYIASLGGDKATRATVGTRIVPKDGGNAWGIKLGPPKPAATPAAAEGDTSTGDASAAAAVASAT